MKPINGEKDTYFIYGGMTERSKAFVKCLEGYTAENYVCVLSKIERPNRTIPAYDYPAENIKRLMHIDQGILQSLYNKLQNGDSVTIDLNSIDREYGLNLARMLFLRGQQLQVRFVYLSSEEDSEPEDIAYTKPEQLLLSPGSPNFGESNFILIATGTQTDAVRRILDVYRPTRLYLGTAEGVNVEPMVKEAKSMMACYKNDPEASIFTFNTVANNPIELCRSIDSLVGPCESIKLATVASAMSAIGIALYSARSGVKVQIEYCIPEIPFEKELDGMCVCHEYIYDPSNLADGVYNEEIVILK
ncbi:MAG: hypothetical protein LBR55_00685 [Bacteroidales bacterium]|jgi:hypothetical protein|nr:hypothetical protein [Bacteroidales bacterium]